MDGDLIGGLIVIVVMLLCIIGWCVHIFTCFTAGLWGFLIAGALFVPIGVIHGLGVMVGIW